MKRFKVPIGIAAAAIIVTAVICIFPLRSRVDSVLTGVRWVSGDETACEEVSVTVSGVYKRYLLRRDVFSGSIMISGIPETEGELLDVEFAGDGFAALNYVSSHGTIEHMGTVFGVSGAFDEIVISVDSADEWISAPAASRREAVDTAVKLLGAEWKFE